MANEADKYVKETLRSASNTNEVLGVIKDQLQVKMELNDDAMQEIIPYLEQGV